LVAQSPHGYLNFVRKYKAISGIRNEWLHETRSYLIDNASVINCGSNNDSNI